MVAIILNLIGIGLVIVSLFFLLNNSRLESKKEDLISENKVDRNFDRLLEEVIQEKTSLDQGPVREEEKNLERKPASLIRVEREEAPYSKVINLHKEGYSNEEIAKTLNKGIREVEIIIKLYK